MFDVDELVEECRTALAETHPAAAVRQLLERALHRPSDVAGAFGEPTRAELTPLHSSDDLTIMKVVWAPGMRIPPHNHLMWAAIGIYGGAEDNQFFRRPGETASSGASLVASGGRSLAARDTLVLGADAIHAVANPDTRAFTGALHIYGGDFMNKQRSLWDAEGLEEEPATGARMQRLFDAANDTAFSEPSGPGGGGSDRA
jgi:predicted metal-dependent enzyme (double-stranded beta helix superfamily)